MHSNTPYDPVKAHEYYIRTRHLKGRRKGTDYQVTTKFGRVETLTPEQLQEQKAYASHRVNVIQNRLAELRTKLQAAIAKQSQKATPHVKTAADKLKAAQKAKTYRQTHHQQLANKAKAATTTKAATSTAKKTSTRSIGSDINSLQDQIAVTKQNLLDAVAKQRRLAAAKKIG